VGWPCVGADGTDGARVGGLVIGPMVLMGPEWSQPLLALMGSRGPEWGLGATSRASTGAEWGGLPLLGSRGWRGPEWGALFSGR
jgi:hypothetical protein